MCPLKERAPAVAAAGAQGAVDGEFASRLSRFSKAVASSRAIADYLRSFGVVDAEALDRGARMERCGSWCWFRHYLGSGRRVLKGAAFCEQRLLCPWCALRVAMKLGCKYAERVSAAVAADPSLVPVLVTLTLRDGPDLRERFARLMDCLKRFVAGFRLVRSGHRWLQRYRVAGGVCGVEVKRGSGSGLWHVHAHWLLLMPGCDFRCSADALSREWHGLTVDSYVVDVRAVDSAAAGVVEVLKYVCKFSEMSYADLWQTFGVCKGRRLRRSFGVLRGVADPVDLLDEDSSSVGPFVDEFFRFVAGRFRLAEVRAQGSPDG